ncbi:hypothetical protein C3L33_22770, partial [Rhododendron williamsianum]
MPTRLGLCHGTGDKNEANDEKRELVAFKEDDQEYTQVLRMLRNCRFEAMCIEGTKCLCHIMGEDAQKGLDRCWRHHPHRPEGLTR